MRSVLDPVRQILCLCGVAGMLVLPLDATARTGLSRWVFDSAAPSIEQLFSDHPRYRDSTLQLRAVGDNALDEALAAALRGALARGSVALRDAVTPPRGSGEYQNIDALDCSVAPVADYQLLVSARATGRAAEVRLRLVDNREPDTELRNWQWRGILSADERDTIRDEAAQSRPSGTLTAPWEDSESAAAALARQLACALRPAISSELLLSWATLEPPAASLFRATLLEARRRLGSYAELANVERPADYRIELRTEPLRPDLWQLWLAGLPQRAGLPAVQAVTYVRGRAPVAAAAPLSKAGLVTASRPVPAAREALHRPGADEPASHYLQVQLLAATQESSRPGRARLELRLRLSNSAVRPIRYGLSLSGGHFRHCLADADYYRHDRYGYLEGELAAGESVVRVMTIAGARHSPRPWFGMRRCAGFRDLDGFEDFAHRGHKVTQFIHWSG